MATVDDCLDIKFDIATKAYCPGEEKAYWKAYVRTHSGVKGKQGWLRHLLIGISKTSREHFRAEIDAEAKRIRLVSKKTHQDAHFASWRTSY